jgi:hypothetical protein
VTNLQTERQRTRGSISERDRYFSFRSVLIGSVGSPSLLSNGYRGLHLRVNLSKREADLLPPFSAEVKNALIERRRNSITPNVQSSRGTDSDANHCVVVAQVRTRLQ